MKRHWRGNKGDRSNSFFFSLYFPNSLVLKDRKSWKTYSFYILQYCILWCVVSVMFSENPNFPVILWSPNWIIKHEKWGCFRLGNNIGRWVNEWKVCSPKLLSIARCLVSKVGHLPLCQSLHAKQVQLA